MISPPDQIILDSPPSKKEIFKGHYPKLSYPKDKQELISHYPPM